MSIHTTFKLNLPSWHWGRAGFYSMSPAGSYPQLAHISGATRSYRRLRQEGNCCTLAARDSPLKVLLTSLLFSFSCFLGLFSLSPVRFCSCLSNVSPWSMTNQFPDLLVISCDISIIYIYYIYIHTYNNKQVIFDVFNEPRWWLGWRPRRVSEFAEFAEAAHGLFAQPFLTLRKGQKTLKLAPQIYESLQKEKVTATPSDPLRLFGGH